MEISLAITSTCAYVELSLTIIVSGACSFKAGDYYEHYKLRVALDAQ